MKSQLLRQSRRNFPLNLTSEKSRILPPDSYNTNTDDTNSLRKNRKRKIPRLGLLLLSNLLALASWQQTASSQLLPDNTLGAENSIVTTQNLIDLIEGGAIRGENLFHSFQEFNVNEGQQVFFANPDGIFNILTRVTGTNPSDIFGTLGVDGAANLILLNPNGINFGANASLDVSGSFFASTAESVVFDNGLEFSATNPQEAPLVTINITPGLQYGTPPQGAINNAGLIDVGAEQSLNLFATEINSTGILFAPGGNISLEATGNITFDGTFVTESGNEIANGIYTRDTTGIVGNSGDVNINAGSVSFTNGARIFTRNVGQGNSGNVNITAIGEVSFDGELNGTSSSIDTINSIGAIGDAGDVNINAGSISLTNGAYIDTRTLEQGDSGDININTIGAVSFDGDISGVYSGVAILAIGNGGDININAASVSLTNGAVINPRTLGEGNGGNVNINTIGAVSFDGEFEGNFSGIYSGVQLVTFLGVPFVAIGDSGDVNINAASFSLTNGAVIDTRTLGQGNEGDVNITVTGDVSFDGDFSGILSGVASSGIGNAGNVNINANSLSFTNGGLIFMFASGTDNTGSITVNTTESVELDGSSSIGIPSSIFSSLRGEDSNIGEITINTGNLSLTNGGGIFSSTTVVDGNAANITVNATEGVFFDGESLVTIPSDSELSTFPSVSGILSFNSNSEGDTGAITVNTETLSITNGAQISNATNGRGNGGRITINATDSISLDGQNSAGASSGIGSFIFPGAEGNSGEIIINTATLSLTNGAEITAFTQGRGNGGLIVINATDSVSLDGDSNLDSNVFDTGVGNAGEIKINTSYFSLTNDSLINVASVGQGDAGNVTINADESIIIAGNPSETLPNSTGIGSFVVSTTSEAVGDGGNVNLDAPVIVFRDGVFVSALNNAQGDAGSVNVNAQQFTVSNDSAILVDSDSGQAGNIVVDAENFTLDQSVLRAETVTGTGGDINVQLSDLLLLRRNSLISSEALSNDGSSGNIDLVAEALVAIPSEDSDIVASAQLGGNVTITVEAILGIRFQETLTNQSDITATGTVTINAPDTNPAGSLTSLPEAPVNPQPIRGCQATVGQGNASFVDRRRGGLLPNPYEALSNGDIWEDMQPPTPVAQNTAEQIVEAQGWKINARGNVELLANQPNNSTQRSCGLR